MMWGHGVNSVVTSLLQMGAVPAKGQHTPVDLNTPAGLVRATAHLDNSGHVEYVSFLNVPSFLYASDVELEVPAYGRLTVDVAFGGAFYAFIPAAQLGLSVAPEHANQLAAAGAEITKVVKVGLQGKDAL